MKIEFLQRAYARLTLSDGSVQYLVPILYGDAGKRIFAEQTPYLFPVVSANPYASLWVLVFKLPDDRYEHDPWTWFSGVFMVDSGRVHTGGGFEGKLVYDVWQPTPPPEVSAPFGDIVCELDEVAGQPVCKLIAAGLNPVDKPVFRIPIGNFTDSRFFGETEDGVIVQGFRLQYD